MPTILRYKSAAADPRESDGRGPRALKRRSDLPLAPPRAVRPPSPEATCDPEPGDSCLAKLGRALPPGQYPPVDDVVDNVGRRRSVPVDIGEPACDVLGHPGMWHAGVPGMTPSTACGREIGRS